MLTQEIQSVLLWLHQHPHWAGMATYLIALTESLAVIGTIIPGSVMMTAVGGLVGSQIIPLPATLLWAIAGAITGDSISYYLGYHFRFDIRYKWPFRYFRSWFDKGEIFFQVHGRKSIFIGRFVGPIRSFVPLIAGMLNVKPSHFFPVNICSAILWAPAYMLPGILLGTTSHALPPKLAIHLLIVVVVGLIVFWSLYWFFKQILDRFISLYQRGISAFFHFIRNNPARFHSFNLWFDVEGIEREKQLSRLIQLLGCIVCFLFICIQVTTHGILTHYNIQILNLMRAIQISPFYDVIVSLTLLGDKQVLAIPFGIVLFWMIGNRNWRLAYHWMMLFGVAYVGRLYFKYMFGIPRPSGLTIPLHGFSFPSGHAVLSTAFYGILASLIAQKLPIRLRRWPYIIAGILITLICFSRVYLGAHWMTDVIAGFFYGLMCCFMILLSYHRTPSKDYSPFYLGIMASISLMLTWSAFGFHFWHYETVRYRPDWHHHLLTTKDWWEQTYRSRPYYVFSRTGHATEVINVQWLGDIHEIETFLLHQGFEKQRILTFFDIFDRLIEYDHEDEYLPWFMPLFQGNPPVLAMTKPYDKNNNIFLLLRLWKTETRSGYVKQLWVGIIDFHIKRTNSLADDTKALDKLSQSTTEIFSHELPSMHWRRVKIPDIDLDDPKLKINHHMMILIQGPNIDENGSVKF